LEKWGVEELGYLI